MNNRWTECHGEKCYFYYSVLLFFFFHIILFMSISELFSKILIITPNDDIQFYLKFFCDFIQNLNYYIYHKLYFFHFVKFINSDILKISQKFNIQHII